MGVLLHGRFDTQRQGRSGTRHHESSRLSGGWNLVLSSGRHARALSELQYLDSAGGNDPLHLQFESTLDLARFFREADTLSRGKPIHVIHAHDLYAASAALLARGTYKYRLVLDYVPVLSPFLPEGIDIFDRQRTVGAVYDRAQSISEESRAVIDRAYSPLSPPSGNGKPRRRFQALEILEEWVLRNADHVIVQTRAAGRYLGTRYSLHADKLSVIPNCVDAAAFRFDATMRDETRFRLGLFYRLIVAHVEDVHEPQDIDSMVKVFRNLLDRCPAAHLLFLSGNSSQVREFLNFHLPQDAFTILSPSPDFIPACLNASDLGFLLPQPSPNSQATSPVLLAQYLNCGVPVIITPGVGDFSSLVRHKFLGEVLKGLMISERLIKAVLHSRGATAQRCIQEGRSLTWQHQQDMAKYVF